MFPRLCKREKHNLDSGPSLHMRKKCSVSACWQGRYRKQQISIFTVWRGSGHVVLFSESWSKPDDLTELLWCHWALSPQVMVVRNSFSEVNGNTAVWQRGEFRADQMYGQEWKLGREVSQKPGWSQRETAALTSGTTWHSAPAWEHMHRQSEKLRTRITLLICRQRPFPGKAELAVSPSLTASTAPGLYTTA